MANTEKTYQILSKKTVRFKKKRRIIEQLRLKLNIYAGDSKVLTKNGIANLQPTNFTHWIVFPNENFFDSNECQQLKFLTIKF